jgi:hypothetical protein
VSLAAIMGNSVSAAVQGATWARREPPINHRERRAGVETPKQPPEQVRFISRAAQYRRT